MDKHWLGSVDSSGWLNMVRCALVAAKEVTHMLCIKKYSVMLLGERIGQWTTTQACGVMYISMCVRVFVCRGEWV